MVGRYCVTRVDVSVMTATYNRASTLPRLWNSLLNQTFKNFEWVIIDDGSVDDTSELVERFVKESFFPITYVRQENRGKHTAYNVFAKHAEADLFFAVDSDDELLPHCLETALNEFYSVPKDALDDYAGVWFLAQDQHERIIGDEFLPQDFSDDVVGVLIRHKKLGDKAPLIKKKILLEFPFPE